MTEELEKTKWTKEVSAGGIVCRIVDAAPEILLIMPKSPNFGPPAGFWTFPKGKQDSPEEDLKVTALREVKEESGAVAEIKDELGYVKFFRNGGDGFPKAIKFVHFYLMQYLSGNPADHDNEVAEAKWFPINEVEKNLKYKHDKEIFERAKVKLISNSCFKVWK